MSLVFILLAGVLVASALGVISFRNPIYSALCLIANLIGVAAIYGLLGAHFLAAAQMIVYAGAIVVLVLFVLMLLNQKEEEGGRRLSFGLLLGLIAPILFLTAVSPLLIRSFHDLPQLGEGIGSVEAIGKQIFHQSVLPFEVASLLLLVAVLGALMIGKQKENS